MTTFITVDTIVQADVMGQITGLGDQMGINIKVFADNGKKITTTANKSTIEVTWTDTTGAKTLAQVLTTSEITAAGYSLGIYYPEGYVFTDQSEVNTFMGPIVAKIFLATETIAA